MSDHFDKLYKAGAEIGFAKGGQVKDTGIQPAKEGTSQQEIEAGGTPKLRPGYEEGGYVPPEKNPYKKGTARYKLWNRKYGKKGKKKEEEPAEGMVKKAEKLKGKSAKWLEEHGMKKGGLAHASKYAKGRKVEVEVECMEEGGAVTKGHMRRSTPHKSSYEKTKHPHMKHGGPYKSEPMFGKK